MWVSQTLPSELEDKGDEESPTKLDIWLIMRGIRDENLR